MNATDIPGWMSIPELYTIAKYATRGRSSLATIQNLKRNSILTIIDPFKDYDPFYHEQLKSLDPRQEFQKVLDWASVHRDDVSIELFEMCSHQAKLPRGHYDVAFIDGDHNYGTVRYDTRL